jgi:hypothetical protein
MTPAEVGITILEHWMERYEINPKKAFINAIHNRSHVWLTAVQGYPGGELLAFVDIQTRPELLPVDSWEGLSSEELKTMCDLLSYNEVINLLSGNYANLGFGYSLDDQAARSGAWR